MDYADVLERNRLDAEESADARDDAVDAATKAVERIMRKQVADALRLQDLTRPLMIWTRSTGVSSVDVGWAVGEWWSEHYTEYLLQPTQPIWDAFLAFWIDTYAADCAREMVK